MAPKKKNNKRGDDDWEADLGESLDPAASAAVEDIKPIENGQNDEHEAGGGGGLLAALKKNKSKKQKKGKVVEEDYLEGEASPTANGLNDHERTSEDLLVKAPEEAQSEDLVATRTVKMKGGKINQGKADETPKDDGNVSEDEVGGLKSKKEKEKERKEREKQRKKEQVRLQLKIRRNLYEADAGLLLNPGC